MMTLAIRGGHLIGAATGAADGPRLVILEQVKNGVAIRMAVVERALTASMHRASEA
jgi:aspartate carbamoyltransferase catalytic subunit